MTPNSVFQAGIVWFVPSAFCYSSSNCHLNVPIYLHPNRIEHLEPDVLSSMPEVVFGHLSPKVVIVTTPNVEFNVLFPGLKGFRHYDHKFEWTRAEFEEWLVPGLVHVNSGNWKGQSFKYEH